MTMSKPGEILGEHRSAFGTVLRPPEMRLTVSLLGLPKEVVRTESKSGGG